MINKITIMEKENGVDAKKVMIEEFLAKLGDVPVNDGGVEGFTLLCNKCNSNNVTFYDDIGYSEYTGAWGNAGLKCKDCGNAKVIIDT